MRMQYTNTLNNKSIIGIMRRFCSNIEPRLTEHGSRVAYIVFRMLHKAGFCSAMDLRDLCLLAHIHDIGAYKTEEISRMLQFETQNVWGHCSYGYLFIRYFSPLKKLAPAILFHHSAWNSLEGQAELTSSIKDTAQIIHIADRIDVSMSVEGKSWKDTRDSLIKGRGTAYAPHLVDLAVKLDLTQPIEEEQRVDPDYFDFLTSIPLSTEETTDYLKMLVFLIDFRSSYTATHTITTTSISYELGLLLDLPESQINQILCGSLLHDLGKIAIPMEILEFPGKLSSQAMSIMMTHVDLTEEIFGGAIDETIQRISLRHHEKLDGSGYPRGLTARELTVMERLVAIADIISALTGKRSYKDSFPKEKITTILTNMKNASLLDSSIVDLTIENLDMILDATADRCKPILDVYARLNEEYESLHQLHNTEEKLQFILSLQDPELEPVWP
ncbi:MAG: HD domain-containing protein [Lacrimispora sp.]|uniref:HD-GYP domain-containing protein n=1 Tax=Lacrimispora sp. TaxID=2719234 RepID=UPI0039E677BA